MPSRMVPPITASHLPAGMYGVALSLVPFTIGASVSVAYPANGEGEPEQYGLFDACHAQ